MTTASTSTIELSGLHGRVEDLRAQVATAVLPLELPGVAEAASGRQRLLNQLDDYILPRLAAIDAPLLAVVGGSTGAGKSTLVNSLVGSVVSRTGVLRPTTRSPVLVHHPQDERWFTGERILAGLGRVSGSEGEHDPSSVRLVVSESLPPGLALLDAPDIDSVVRSNRDLADQLLAAADLWVFVTTAARYADAVPWVLLRQAAERGTAIAVVLDRVPPDVADEVRPHLVSMLKEQGLGLAPVFTIAEASMERDGMLGPEHIGKLQTWLTALARDAKARAIVVRQTLTGALDSLDQRIEALVGASAAQLDATKALLAAADAAYAEAADAVHAGMTDGTLLRGEVLSRWQEFVGTGEFLKQVESRVARARDRVVAMVKGEPTPERDLGEALHTGVAALVSAEAQTAGSRVARSWRGMPGGEQLLVAHPGLGSPSDGFHERVEALVRHWQDDVLTLVRTEGKDRRTTARVAAYGVNGVGVVLMLTTFAYTGGVTGAEVGIAGGTAVLGQKLLEAIFGDQAVRSLATKARAALLERVQQLFAEEALRFQEAVDAVQVPRDQGRRLSAAVLAVKAAR
ncbi:MAG: dynamin family protein [Dermatophilaceae bacterium]